MINLIPLPIRLLIAAVVLAALAAAGVAAKHHYDEGKRAEGRAEVQAKWDRANAKAAAVTLAVAQANAAETLRRLDRQQENDHVQTQALARAADDAARARAAAAGVQQRADQLLDDACTGATGGDPAAVASCKAAGSPARVLADLRSRADERAGILAEYADRARIAGETCVRDYDALTAAP